MSAHRISADRAVRMAMPSSIGSAAAPFGTNAASPGAGRPRCAAGHLIRAVLGMVCMTAGCGRNGPDMVPVEGLVTLGAKPLAGASVLFQPRGGGRPATGVTDEQGRFTLQTFQPGDGALVGVNDVSVAKLGVADAAKKLEEGEYVAPVYLTPKKYASPVTSGLMVDVKRGLGPVKLDLQSKP